MAPPRRRPLGVLFLLLAAGFAAVAAYAALGGQWIVMAAAAALGVWMGELSFRQLR